MPVHPCQQLPRGRVRPVDRVGDRGGPRVAVDPPRARAEAGLHAAGELHRMIAVALMSAAAMAAAGTSPVAGAAATKRVEIFDNYYAPTKLTVRAGTIVAWVWPEIPVDVHDVKLR